MGKGVIQEATFVMADPGHATADTPCGEDDTKTRRNNEDSWTKK